MKDLLSKERYCHKNLDITIKKQKPPFYRQHPNMFYLPCFYKKISSQDLTF